MGGAELDAFVDECMAVEATLATVPGDAWGRPALGAWTLAELVAHLVRQVSRVTAYADLPVEDDRDGATGATAGIGPALLDRVDYYRYDAEAVAPGVAERARAEAAGVDPATLPDRFAAAWRADAERARALPADRVVRAAFGPMRLDELLATRVLEVTVHHVDLRAALDLPPSPTPAAGRLTAALLEGLLERTAGGRRPRNLGRVRFILAATGRMPADDPRLPVLR